MANIAGIRAGLAGLIVFGMGLAVTPSAKAQVVGAGTFNLTGAIDVTGSAFTFGDMVAPPPGDQMARITSPLTGQFSDITAGVSVPIKNLAAPTVTPGTPFLVSDWITLPDGIDLDLMNIPISSASHTCTSADDAPGSICRAIANSPITLEQGTDGVTALMNLSGVAYFASSPGTTTPWSGKLAADFSGETISGLLTTFTTNGHITTGYQANFVTLPPTLTPQQMTRSIIAAVNVLSSQGVLNGGQDNSLVVKLQHAIDKMNGGNTAAAMDNLNSFIGEVNDLLGGGVLTSSQATPLISAAESVIARLP
jgi:hypothetical protein